jgi:hypothetical protein
MTSDDLRPVEQLPLSDWTDQDLLTKSEARERLIDEIGRTQARLSQLDNANFDEEAEVTLLTRRLNAIESIRDEYTAHLSGHRSGHPV